MQAAKNYVSWLISDLCLLGCVKLHFSVFTSHQFDFSHCETMQRYLNDKKKQTKKKKKNHKKNKTKKKKKKKKINKKKEKNIVRGSQVQQHTRQQITNVAEIVPWRGSNPNHLEKEGEPPLSIISIQVFSETVFT